MDWRLIRDAPADPFRNMAVDEAIFKAFSKGSVLPTVRIYSWVSPSISLGYFQNYEKSICGCENIPIVRRPTGGRAVAHGSDLTFSLVVPETELGSRVGESYHRIGQVVALALRSAGIIAEFCANYGTTGLVDVVNCFELGLKYEVSVGGQKVLGSAQARSSGCILQQNSLMLNAPPEEALQVINCEPYLDWPEMPLEKVEQALLAELEREFSVKLIDAGLSTAENALVEELLVKYKSSEWTLRRATCVDSTPWERGILHSKVCSRRQPGGEKNSSCR